MAENKKETITPKQEFFIQELIKGKSQRQAYKAAFDCEKMKDETIDRRAHDLFRMAKIKARYDKIMEGFNKKALWTRDRALNELIEMLTDSKADRNYQGRYNAIKELNTLVGLYPKEKSEVELTINKPNKEMITNTLSKFRGVKR